MKIDRVVIGCYFGDYWFAKICVASVRRWYPDVRITLLKDITFKPFDSSEIEHLWKVDHIEVSGYGNPSAKIEVFNVECSRFLFLDADIVMVGPLLDHLERYDQDVVVSPSYVEDPNGGHIKDCYYNWEQLKRFDPVFEYPGYGINTGQFCATHGAVKFDEITTFFTQKTTKNHVKYPEIFVHNEQGILSYLLPLWSQQGEISLALDPFKLNAHPSVVGELDYSVCTSGSGIPHIIHWMGAKADKLENYQRADILKYYRDYYCQRLSGGMVAFDQDRAQAIADKHAFARARNIYARLPVPLRIMAQNGFRLLKMLRHG